MRSRLLTIVIKNVLVMEEVAQCTMEVSKLADSVDYLQNVVWWLNIYDFIQKTSMDQLILRPLHVLFFPWWFLPWLPQCCLLHSLFHTYRLEYDSPTAVHIPGQGKPAFFKWLELGTNFSDIEPLYFWWNAPNGSKLGARTITEPVPCWWKSNPMPWKNVCICIFCF